MLKRRVAPKPILRANGRVKRLLLAIRCGMNVASAFLEAVVGPVGGIKSSLSARLSRLFTAGRCAQWAAVWLIKGELNPNETNQI